MIKNRLNDEKGMILAMVLMLMVVIAVLGVMTINTSTIDIQIFGNQKTSSESFEMAQAGVDVSIPIIENTLDNGAVPVFNSPHPITLAADLEGEVLGSTVSTDSVGTLTDVTVTTGGATAKADIDRLFTQALAGGSLEFAGGYEGVGAAAAGGGTAILYRIRSEGFR